MPRPAESSRPLVAAAVAGFAAFGAFWGAWGASIPPIRAQAGLDDTQLGVALLFVGAGALPAMLLTGRAVDRWGLRLAAPAIAAVGGSGVVVALAGRGLVSLSAALAVVGAASGAADVVINTIAGRAEREARRPVITRVHAVFSTSVVVASLGTGLLTRVGAPVVTQFAVVAAGSLAAAGLIRLNLPGPLPGRALAGDPDAESHHRARGFPTLTLLGFGALGALAFASENAHQSWSAVFVTDALSGGALGTLAPAVFAAVVAVTRFAAGGLGARHARVVLAAGAGTAAVGALVVSAAPDLAVGLVGLSIAAAGTAVLFPTILGMVSRRVPESHRGRAVSVVTTVSYLGFLLGPVYVGFWAGAVGIRGAMVAVAGLGVVLMLLSPLVRPRATSTVTPAATARSGCPRGR